jgi:Putative phage tail protein
LSSLFGSQPKVIPEFTGLQVNTSVQVLPIPIIYGTPRVTINLLYYNGFHSVLASAGGGKGVLSGGKGAKQVQYFATIILGIGEGTIGPVRIIYQDQNVWTPGTFPSNGAFYFDGGPGQVPWSYIVSNWPADARPYKSTAYYGFSNAQLDASATVPQINLVISGILADSSPLVDSTITIATGQYDPNGNPLSFIGNIHLGACDADPAKVIYDFLTNETYGATFPGKWIDNSTLFTSANGYDVNTGDTAVSSFCQAVGLAWSVVINNVESANSIIDRWCKNLNVAPIWNGAVLKFIPYWDRYEATNPNWSPLPGIPKKYFTPYTTAICTITLDQILQSEDKSEDPITFSRKDPVEVYNTVRLDFRDRNNFFNDNPVEVKDEAHIELNGPRVDNIGTANEFSYISYAYLSALMQLRRNISIMRTFTWKMGPLWGWIDPMDIFNIPDPANYSNTVTVRVTEVTDDEEENVTIVAEEYPVGSQSPTTIPSSVTTPPNQGPTNIPPSQVYPPVIFAPTTGLLAAQGIATPQVILGAAGGNAPVFMGELDTNWAGANIWVSLDNITYQEIGTLFGPSTIGTLTQSISGYGGVNPDNTDTLFVNLSESDGILASVSIAAAASGASLAVLQDVSGFEIIGYTTATLISPFTYALTGLYRGLYGTTSRHFGIGSNFLYVGQTANYFETALPPQYVGKTFWVKLQSFNTFQTNIEDLASAIAYQYIATSPTPVPPTPPPMIVPTYRRVRTKSNVATTRKRKPR